MNQPKPLLTIKRAVKAGDVDQVHRLLAEDSHLVVTTGHGWTPFQDAAFHAKTQIVKVMLAEGSGITPADISHALHHAVQLPHTDPEIIEVLLATRQVPVMFAALYRNDIDAAGDLLQSTPDLVHSRDAGGCTPLIRAAENAQAEMVRLLLAHGADLESRGPYRKSALSSCSCNQVDRGKRSRTLRLLLESGADVNGRTHRGRTPLFSAATAGWGPEDSVRILLEYEADPSIRNDDGLTVLDEVLLRPSARSERVARLLREARA